jgi:hypothetical protein
MTQQVEVKLDKQQLRSVKRLLSAYPKGEAKALQRAVNKVGVSARTHMVKEIRQEVNLKAGELKRRNVTLKKANRRTLTAHLTVQGARVPLSSFGARATRKGITVTVNKRKGRQRIDSAFLRRDRKGVWKRLEKQRLPITELHGPSVPVVVDSIPEISGKRYDSELLNALLREVDVQIGLILEKGK